MKKSLILLIASVALLASCAKPDKCKCTIEVGKLTLKDQIIDRPSDTSCSKIKVEDLDGEVVDVNLSSVASINCSNYQE